MKEDVHLQLNWEDVEGHQGALGAPEDLGPGGSCCSLQAQVDKRRNGRRRKRWNYCLNKSHGSPVSPVKAPVEAEAVRAL